MWKLATLSIICACMWTSSGNETGSQMMSSSTEESSLEIGLGTILFPNPLTDGLSCGRRRPSFLCDPNNLLPPEQAERLDFLLNDMKNSTPCLCSECPTHNKPDGITVGILLQNFTEETRDLKFNINELADRIREEWKLGKCEDDIIIVVSAGEKSYVSLGDAVKQILPEHVAEQIAQDCNLHFETGTYGQGLKSMVNSFRYIVQQSPPKDTKSRRKRTGLIIGISLGTILIIILIASFVILMCRRKYRQNNPENQKAATGWKKPDPHSYVYSSCKTDDFYSVNKSSKDTDDQSDDFQDLDLRIQGEYRKRELSDVAEETEDSLPAEVILFPKMEKKHSHDITEL